MRAGSVICLFAIGVAGLGCRAPVTLLKKGTPAPTYAAGEPLAVVTPQAIAPDLSQLSPADANAPVQKSEWIYRGLDERTAQCRAAAESSVGKMLDVENARTSVLGSIRRHGTINAAGDDLLRETRRLAALDARNRSALTALERYLQLADVVGRRELFAAGITSFDDFRNDAVRLRGIGLPAPQEQDLLVQRAALLASLEEIDAKIALLNHDLNSRLNLKLAAGERLWPLGAFAVTSELPDADAAVKTALSQRPDLALIRTMQQRLSAQSLPSVREALQSLNGLLGSSSPLMSMTAFSRRQPDGPSPAEQDELESRKKQLADLLATREAETAAEVRTALGQMSAATRRTAILQTRVESLTAKHATEKAAKHIADLPTIEIDLLKAKADVLAAAMEWQQWRVKLKAAQGVLAMECMMSAAPPSPPVAPGMIPVKVNRTLRFARPGK